MFVGQILSVTRHPDADRLTLVRVDYGAESGPLTVVTGAPNLYPYVGREFHGDGPKVAFAVVGSRLDGHSESGSSAEASKIRGIESPGMVCAEGPV
jgi:phenylalanyl-tRNA synthetase beta chain